MSPSISVDMTSLLVCDLWPPVFSLISSCSRFQVPSVPDVHVAVVVAHSVSCNTVSVWCSERRVLQQGGLGSAQQPPVKQQQGHPSMRPLGPHGPNGTGQHGSPSPFGSSSPQGPLRQPEPYGHHGPNSPSGPHHTRPQGPPGPGPHGPFPPRGPGIHNGPLAHTAGPNGTKVQSPMRPHGGPGGSAVAPGTPSSLSSPQPHTGEGLRSKEDSISPPAGSQHGASVSEAGSSTSPKAVSQQSAEADRVG